jgi:general secretion pathway protein I
MTGSTTPWRTTGRDGFTLLEVMVAIAILAVSLTAIFASQGGAIKVAHRARKVTVASLLARCKMGEIEQMIHEEGFPAIERGDEDGCCEDAEVEGFTCDWVVERVELPEPGVEGDGAEKDTIDTEEGGEEAAGLDLAGAGSVEDVLSGSGGLGGGDMITEMAMSYAFPILQDPIEEQIRRAKVEVRWHEGSRERSFIVVQYLVAEPGLGGVDE